MDNLGIFLRRQAKKLLDTSIQQLRTGIISRLSQKYTPLYGEEKAAHLSKSIINRCMLEEPEDMEGKIFYQNNIHLVENELSKLSEDCNIAKALSYLYAARTLYRSSATRKSYLKFSQEIADQAARLNIPIPDTYTICGSADVNDCVIEIMKFAAAFNKESQLQSNNST